MNVDATHRQKIEKTCSKQFFPHHVDAKAKVVKHVPSSQVVGKSEKKNRTDSYPKKRIFSKHGQDPAVGMDVFRLDEAAR